MVIEALTQSKIQSLFVWLISMVLAATTPIAGLVTALIFAWLFNVWCGMRADGVINIKCKNWSWRKFSHAILELCMYIVIIELIAIAMHLSGDSDQGYYACKTINYVFAWFNFENGMKNLCKAYPKNRAFWIVYLFIRFEFAKMLKIDYLIELYEQRQNRLHDESK